MLTKIEDLTPKELHRLSRRDLLILLLEQVKQTEELERSLAEEQAKHHRELTEKEAAYAEKLETQQQINDLRLALLKQRLEYETKAHASPPSLFSGWEKSRVWQTLQTVFGCRKSAAPAKGGHDEQ